jgi:flagellar motor component MotA
MIISMMLELLLGRYYMCAYVCRLLIILEGGIGSAWIDLRKLNLMDVQTQLLLVFSLHGNADIHDVLAHE